jgi:aspartate/methionine/tyrosine aminotransferase
MGAVQDPIIPIVGELVRSHPGTISLGQGVVHYGPPEQSIAAIARFLENPQNHKYGPVDGIPELKYALQLKLAAENGIDVEDGSRVIVTAGGNMAFMNAVLAILDEGDEVILPVPYYFNHEMAITIAGARPVAVPAGPGFQLDPDRIREAITPSTRAVVTVSPNNPTGAVYSESVLREVNEICRDAGIYHVNDEAYEYFTFTDARHFSPRSIAGRADHTIALYSFSKSYGFASWRIGYMVAPDHLADPIAKIQDTNLICPPVVSQYAALGALEAGEPFRREKIDGIASTRELVIDELSEIADLCTVGPADGALYFLLRVHSELPPMTLVERLVTEHAVAAIPGSTFGLEGCYLRISFGALERETVAEGIGRFVEGLRAIV